MDEFRNSKNKMPDNLSHILTGLKSVASDFGIKVSKISRKKGKSHPIRAPLRWRTN
jgi:hypothetical protein